MEGVADYNFQNLTIDSAVVETYNKHGYIMIRNLLTPEEIEKLKKVLHEKAAIMSQGYKIKDGTDKILNFALWSHPGKDITGMVARSDKVAGTYEKLLGGEIYHFHSKVVSKQPGGAGLLWHQDYGYWYDHGCVAPDMGTVYMAVDKATKENGCLQVIPRSHLVGRINHKKESDGDQYFADEERLGHIINRCGSPVYCEMEPGDALFFHCNVLHRSDQNNSGGRRLGYLVAFNRADNNPVLKVQYDQMYKPLQKVPNSAILQCAEEPDLQGMGFYTGKDGSPDMDNFVLKD